LCDHAFRSHDREVTRKQHLDEAQEALTAVLSEVRVLASKDLDSRQLLCVVVAGDARLVERVRTTPAEGAHATARA
jgi:nicotinamide riboside kinase